MQRMSSTEVTISNSIRELSSEEMTFVSGGKGAAGHSMKHHGQPSVDCEVKGGELLSVTGGAAIAGSAGLLPGAMLGALGGFVGDFFTQISNGPCGNH
jgi:hypothetical protein